MMTKWQGILLVGPPNALLHFARGLTGAVLTELILYRTCLNTLNIRDPECSMLLSTNAGTPEAMNLENKVEPHASIIIMIQSLIESLLPAMVSLFLGPWSDQGGRKPLILAAGIGYSLTFSILLLMCNWDINPWYLLLAILPANIMGGNSIAKLASNCFISDKTNAQDRVVPLALLEISIRGGNLFGKFAGALIYNKYGITVIFITAAACCASALIYACTFIPAGKVDNTSKKSIQGIFQISLIKKLFTSVHLKQGKFHRSIMWLAILALTLDSTVNKGDVNTIEYLFTRTRLGWNIQDYTNFSAAGSLLSIAGVYGLKFRNCLPDTILAGFGLLSAIAASITKSLTWQSWHMYLSLCVGLLSGIVPPIIRTVISKNVPSEDIGSVFTLTSLIEKLGPLIGTPLYTLIYTNYLPPIYPSRVHLLSICFYLLLFIFLSLMGILIKKAQASRNHKISSQTKL